MIFSEQVEADRLQRYRTSHILHLILTLITGGIWLPVWVIISIRNAIKRGKSERRLYEMALAEVKKA